MSYLKLQVHWKMHVLELAEVVERRESSSKSVIEVLIGVGLGIPVHLVMFKVGESLTVLQISR